MGPDDLVLCAGTLPRGVPFAERLSVAADAGFRHISLWGRDIAAARAEGPTDADMRSMLADHGLGVAEVDPAWWWLPGASEVHIEWLPWAAEGNLVEATLHHRQLPGDGEFDLVGLVDTLADTGTAAPLGVEVCSDTLHELGPLEAARRAASGTRTVLEERT